MFRQAADFIRSRQRLLAKNRDVVEPRRERYRLLYITIKKRILGWDSQWTLPRAQPTSLRWRRKCGWEPKSHHFKRS